MYLQKTTKTMTKQEAKDLQSTDATLWLTIFGGQLPIKTVHNVPAHYEKMFVSAIGGLLHEREIEESIYISEAEVTEVCERCALINVQGQWAQLVIDPPVALPFVANAPRAWSRIREDLSLALYSDIRYQMRRGNTNRFLKDARDSIKSAVQRLPGTAVDWLTLSETLYLGWNWMYWLSQTGRVENFEPRQFGQGRPNSNWHGGI